MNEAPSYLDLPSSSQSLMVMKKIIQKKNHQILSTLATIRPDTSIKRHRTDVITCIKPHRGRPQPFCSCIASEMCHATSAGVPAKQWG
jgi:hypothetical protein